jgi:hypothetical protein
MTNTEKYLKDGVSVEEFVNEFHNFCAKQNNNNASSISLEQFLSRKATPTLTEDERVILRNIKKEYITILRDKAGYLGITTERDENGVRGYNALEFNRCLFPFIKERRRILYKRIIRR